MNYGQRGPRNDAYGILEGARERKRAAGGGDQFGNAQRRAGSWPSRKSELAGLAYRPHPLRHLPAHPAPAGRRACQLHSRARQRPPGHLWHRHRHHQGQGAYDRRCRLRVHHAIHLQGVDLLHGAGAVRPPGGAGLRRCRAERRPVQCDRVQPDHAAPLQPDGQCRRHRHIRDAARHAGRGSRIRPHPSRVFRKPPGGRCG